MSSHDTAEQAGAGPAASGRGDAVVRIRTGAVRGVAGERAAVWKGIRYAQPPIGARRWRAPVAAEPWEGVADATTFGAAAPQQLTPAISLGPDPELDEDCLFLNVWRPNGGTAGKPVMVWIHGGAYTYGSASQPLFDAEELATTGDVVVVTINYRIGALGFLDLSSFSTDEQVFDSNLALRDVLLALAWVRDNVAAFGGDPGRVTVFGESAGGGLVTTLLATPAAAGLFQAAIAESSPASSMYGPARARAVAERFLTAVGVEAANAAAVLRRLPVDRIVDAATAVYSDVPSSIPGTLAFAPVVDGDLVPEAPITVLDEGRGLPVPLLIGTNRDEATLFRYMKSPLIPITRDAIERMFALMLADNPRLVAPRREQVLSAYRGVREKARGLDIATDIGFRMPAVWIASGHARVAPTYLYRFDFTTLALRLLGIRAAHGTELPYVWGALHNGRTDPTFRLGGRRAGERLSARMLRRWTAFARTGVPGDDWPAYTDSGRATLVIDAQDRVAADLDRPLREAWGDVVLSFR
ncbi:carboxylesterase/lipase family protein [Leifsonia aquatica]|uniref:carboxylesterase/lipase family protein n=1 Tax=Leifsonia aquatica TaxID=144185 RepID=UPI000468575E|nr:carboxylesterase/lipase family protein [Leifsonia aquatica]